MEEKSVPKRQYTEEFKTEAARLKAVEGVHEIVVLERRDRTIEQQMAREGLDVARDRGGTLD